MHQELYERLKSVATQGTTTTYAEVAPLADLEMEDPSNRDEVGACWAKYRSTSMRGKDHYFRRW